MTGTSARSPAMPPFVGNLARNADYYGLEWLPDMFPGRRVHGELQPHPIYGAYVIKDYADQFDRRPGPGLMDAMRVVARAAVGRMERHEGALVFWYEPSASTSRTYTRHYSGLTQGYYATALARAGQILGDDALLEAAEAAFSALTVPSDRGGVLFDGIAGPSIAEVPQEPNSLILNGWQSALIAARDYAALTGSTAAADLLGSSVAEMVRLLPLYDAPALRNSRYGLSGFAYARLLVTDVEARDVRLDHARVLIGRSAHAIPVGNRSRWQNYVFDRDVEPDGVAARLRGRSVRMNVVLSRETFPEPNRLEFRLRTPGTARVVVQIEQGRYDPLASAQADRRWTTVAERSVVDRGLVSVALPWDVADLVAYPTNFAKLIDGKNTNIYHRVHIDRLHQLHRATGAPDLHEWATRWSQYIDDWRDMPVYDGLYVRSGGGVSPAHPRDEPTSRSRRLPGQLSTLAVGSLPSALQRRLGRR